MSCCCCRRGSQPLLSLPLKVRLVVGALMPACRRVRSAGIIIIKIFACGVGGCVCVCVCVCVGVCVCVCVRVCNVLPLGEWGVCTFFVP